MLANTTGFHSLLHAIIKNFHMLFNYPFYPTLSVKVQKLLFSTYRITQRPDFLVISLLKPLHLFGQVFVLAIAGSFLHGDICIYYH